MKEYDEVYYEYNDYYKLYKGLGYSFPDRKAVERVCMVTDVYYSDDIPDRCVRRLCDIPCCEI